MVEQIESTPSPTQGDDEQKLADPFGVVNDEQGARGLISSRSPEGETDKALGPLVSRRAVDEDGVIGRERTSCSALSG